MPIMSDRAPPLSSRFSLWCLRAFILAAVAGAVIALFAPVTFVRVLGIVALAGGVLGLVLHSLLLRRDHPAAWAALRVRGVPGPSRSGRASAS